MKQIKRIFAIMVFINFSSNLIAQSKSAADLKLSLDCADENFVVKGNSDKCLKFVLVGADAGTYTLVSAIVSFNTGHMLKEYLVTGSAVFSELQTAMKKMSKGEHVFIENAKVKNNTSGIIKTLPATKITIK